MEHLQTPCLTDFVKPFICSGKALREKHSHSYLHLEAAQYNQQFDLLAAVQPH